MMDLLDMFTNRLERVLKNTHYFLVIGLKLNIISVLFIVLIFIVYTYLCSVLSAYRKTIVS